MFVVLSLLISLISIMCIVSVMKTVSELRRETRAFRAEFARTKSF